MMKISDYYFDLFLADIVAAVIIVLSSITLSQISVFKKLPIWIAVVVSSVVPLLVYPVTSGLILHAQLGYLAFYSYLFVGIVAVGQIPNVSTLFVPLVCSSMVWMIPYNFIDTQGQYYDRVIANLETRIGEVDLVQWKDNYWLYYLDQVQFSTLDGHMYGEAFVHPAMSLVPKEAKILVVGGDNGLVLNELSKYPNVDIEVLPYDQEFADFIRSQAEKFKFTATDNKSISTTAWQHLIDHPRAYDGIFIDLPDLEDPHIYQYASQEFFELCQQALRPTGVLITHTGNPYFDKEKLEITSETMKSVGLQTLAYHAHIPTIGEWSWLMASSSKSLKPKLGDPDIPTRWIDEEAMQLMLHFGKSSYFHGKGQAINTISKPALSARE
ncbi:MAG: hypothetical protein AAGC88_03190, partial [Bacteroidota bacterium]